MPFSETSKEHTEQYWTSHFESFLKPLIEECPNVVVHRSEPLRGDVLKQIIGNLVVSPVVVADLTDGNPNVFWELGVRQSFKHGTITIAEEGTRIPFDISVKGILFYHPKNHIKNAVFAKKFKRAIQDVLSHPDAPDSHVLETISGRGTMYEIIRRDEAARRMEALISENKDNQRVIDSIYKQVNKPRPSERELVTERLRSAAVELLVTHRYLDEPSSFYRAAELCCLWIGTINDQLAVWEHKKETTESWLAEAKETIYGIFEKYKKKITAARKKMARSI